MKIENKTQKRQKSKKLMRQYEISQHLAFAVVNNECSLHDAILRSRSEVELTLLESRHDLDKKEVALLQSGDSSLTDILIQKNYKNHIDETDADPMLVKDFSGTFWRHGGEPIRGVVIENTQYDVELLTEEGSISLPKLQIKAFSAAELEPECPSKEDCEPILRIEDRFRISNRQLYRFLLDETTVSVSLLGGLSFQGRFIQIGRYECILLGEEDKHVVLMRHAFSLVTEVE
jgi:sRNA-binding regulator protein Hfq